MPRFIVIDFETYWDSKNYTLKKMGPIEYIGDVRFDPFMLGYMDVNDDAPTVVDGTSAVREAVISLNLSAPDTYVIGHNINGFDGIILSKNFYVQNLQCIDTMALARWLGISRMVGDSHAALTEFLGHGHKTAGTTCTDGKKWHEVPEADKATFRAYCAADVQQCRDNFLKLAALCNSIGCGSDEARAMPFMASILTARMAAYPELVLDPGAIQAFLGGLEAATEEARKRVQHLLKCETPADFLKVIRSKEKFAAALRQLGVDPPVKVSERKSQTAGKKVYDYAFSKSDSEFLALREHPSEDVSLLVDTRLGQNSSIHKTRAQRLLQVAEISLTLPVLLNVFKAHTGRYTAGNVGGKTDGIGVQNLSKHNPKYRALRKAILAPDGHVLVACDSSQIEARLLAWMAGEDELVQQFRDGKDVYAELATKFPGAPSDGREISEGAKAGDAQMKMLRQLGKKFILSCGYGVSSGKVAKALWAEGLRLDDSFEVHAATAAEYHAIYKSQNYNIIRFWKMCDQVIAAMYSGGETMFGGPTGDFLTASGRGVAPYITSPFGYRILYPELDHNVGDIDGFSYKLLFGSKPIRTKMYGGKLTENVVQSVAFLLMMWQAIRMHKDNVKLVCNLHDSWTAVVLDDPDHIEMTKKKMMAAMSSVPSFMKGFPVACEVEVGHDFMVA